MSLIVEMPYIGRILSKNYYKVWGSKGFKTTATRPEVRAWMDQLISMAGASSSLKEVVGRPCRVELRGQFTDMRSVPDLHNLHEVIADALKVALDIDDRFIGFMDLGFTVGAREPKIIMEVVPIG